MVIRCSHCNNIIMPSEYKGVYRCSYCHIWLRENEVIKTESVSASGLPGVDIQGLEHGRNERSLPESATDGHET